MTRVSLCLTVLNEANSIDALFATIRAQTRRPDEIIVVDGGSTDATLDRLRAYDDLPVQVIARKGATISAGRNAAIGAASGDIIAVTDAGVRLAPDWLALLAGAIEDGADVAAGFFIADPGSDFEVAMGATVLPNLEDIDPARFLPSSRSIAFRRAVWAAVGGYPEWLDYCEDLLFDLAYRDAGYRQEFVPQAVAHFRPRGTLKTFWLQYYRYARGDGKADLWRKRQAARYLTYGVAAPALLGLGRRVPLAYLLLATGGMVYLWPALRRCWLATARWNLTRRIQVLAWVPVIRVVGDLAKMAGYPVGVAWRLTRRRPAELPPA